MHDYKVTQKKEIFSHKDFLILNISSLNSKSLGKIVTFCISMTHYILVYSIIFCSTSQQNYFIVEYTQIFFHLFVFKNCSSLFPYQDLMIQPKHSQELSKKLRSLASSELGGNNMQQLFHTPMSLSIFSQFPKQLLLKR